MNYIHSLNPLNDSATHIARQITEHLESGDRVLWLLSGGSSTSIAVEVAGLLKGVQNIKNLSISLTDERYGKPEHADENWQQLLNLGFAVTGAKKYRPLKGADKPTTLKAFDIWIKQQIAEADYAIGIFGIGTDGHTAGIKPGSDATSAGGYATLFTGNDFERLTITYQAIIKLDEAVIQASGEDKRDILNLLLKKGRPLAEMPAQILHKIPAVTLYSDVQLDI